MRIPKYHRGSGQGLVQIRGRRIYLGKYGSARSKERYRRLVADLLSGNSHTNPEVDEPLGDGPDILALG